MSSYRAELANASRWMNAVAAQLPEAAKPDLAREWQRLTEALEDCRSEGSMELAILQWRQELGQRLSVRLAHSPLEAG